METGVISFAHISASSTLDSNHAANQSRLHSKAGAWSAATNNAIQWLQVDLIGPYTVVTGVATQGKPGTDSQWVTKYRLRYSHDGAKFLYY